MKTNNGWISVDSAMPATERPVLAFYFNSHQKRRRIRAFYVPRFTVESNSDDEDGADEYCSDKDNYYLKEGWYEDNEHEDVHWHVGEPILFWMPLPDPPMVCDPEKGENDERNTKPKEDAGNDEAHGRLPGSKQGSGTASRWPTAGNSGHA